MANSKDVVVTGVSTGIGWGTTKVLISKGFRVFGSVRKQSDGDRLQKEFGDGFVPLLMDITDADAVGEAARKVGSMTGDRNLVGLVNNAGVVVSGPLLYLRPSEYRRQLDVNMIAPLVVIQAFASLLGTDKKRQGPAGRIVNISSSGAKVAIPLLGAYSASKFGLEGMSDALRRELMLFGIDVVIIEPGTVNTAMYDKGEKEDLSEFKPTAYWEAVQKFQKFIVTEARTNGLSPERLGEAVHVALSSAKPKVRYAVIPQRFKNWILPRLLPARMVDAQLAKMLGLTKPSRPGTAGLTSHDEGKPRIVEREHGAIGAALARSACQFLAASLGTARLPRRRPALTTVLDGRSSKPPDRPAANPCKSATLVSHDTLCAAR